MKRLIAIWALLFLTIPAIASFTEDRGKDHVIAWWVSEGNTGPIPGDGYKLGFNDAGEQVIKSWITAKMGAARPSYANLHSRGATSAAPMVQYDNRTDADITNGTKPARARVT